MLGPMSCRLVRAAPASAAPDPWIVSDVIRGPFVNGDLGQHANLGDTIAPTEDAGALGIDPDQGESLRRRWGWRVVHAGGYRSPVIRRWAEKNPERSSSTYPLGCPFERSFRIFGFRPLWVEWMLHPRQPHRTCQKSHSAGPVGPNRLSQRRAMLMRQPHRFGGSTGAMHQAGSTSMVNQRHQAARSRPVSHPPG